MTFQSFAFTSWWSTNSQHSDSRRGSAFVGCVLHWCLRLRLVLARVVVFYWLYCVCTPWNHREPEPGAGSPAHEDTPHLGVNVPALVTTLHSTTAVVCFHGVCVIFP